MHLTAVFPTERIIPMEKPVLPAAEQRIFDELIAMRDHVAKMETGSFIDIRDMECALEHLNFKVDHEAYRRVCGEVKTHLQRLRSKLTPAELAAVDDIMSPL